VVAGTKPLGARPRATASRDPGIDSRGMAARGIPNCPGDPRCPRL
jgi:hypothetical protein